ncbi:MAG: PQQ-binding-like beta-propeller repeat protein [Pirellulales bacterium]
MRCLARLFFACSLLLVAALPCSAQNNWPQLRGADSMGFVPGVKLPDHWSTTENIAWKTDLPGRGWSSPIVWGDKIFVTTCVNSGDTEEIKKGLYFGGERPKPSDDPHSWKVICLDLNTGSIVWDQTAHEGVPATPIHLKNSYASETPVTDGERVYAYFGNVGVFCYSLDGKLLWEKKLEPKKMRFGWGTATSPVVYEGKLFIVNDNDEDAYLLGLDARTGEELFRVAREGEKSNWATPYIWKNSQRVELITPGTKKNRSYDLEGRLLWELEGMSSITIALPYSQDDVLYISSGYVMDKNKPVYAIRPGASGDISLKDEQNSNDFIIWRNNNAGPYNPTSLLYKDLLYVLYDRGIFGCFDPATGEEVYERKRIPEGRAFTSSPWASDDKIFCLNEDGVTFVIRAGKEFEILHTNTLAEDDLSMATPAIVGDRLLLRTDKRIYCIQEGAKLAE